MKMTNGGAALDAYLGARKLSLHNARSQLCDRGSSLENTVRQFKNTVRQFKNTVRQFQNTVQQFKNTVRQFRNTVRQFKNTIRQFKNSASSCSQEKYLRER
jgi:Sec-independent protein translocase protein TatA